MEERFRNLDYQNWKPVRTLGTDSYGTVYEIARDDGFGMVDHAALKVLSIPAAPEDAIKTLMDAGYPYLVSSVLAARGVTTSEQAAEALEREKTLAHSPFLMKDMDKAVARISRALENGEKLAVFGDYDVDGITSTCLLTDYLRSRGADVTAASRAWTRQPTPRRSASILSSPTTTSARSSSPPPWPSLTPTGPTVRTLLSI